MNGRNKDISEMTAEERKAYLKEIREQANQTINNTRDAFTQADDKIKTLSQEPKAASPSTSGVFSQTKNNQPSVKEEQKKGPSNRGGCNIL